MDPGEGLSVPLPKVSVAIVTNGQRNRSLIELLECLSEQQGDNEVFELIITVTLNGPAKSNDHDLERILQLCDKFALEETPGIPFARNKSLQLAYEAEVDYVAFIDDDETVPNDWIHKGLAELQKFGANGVAGAIDYRFELPIPDWQRHGGFYDSPDLQPGTNVMSARTGNLLLESAVIWRQKRPYFNPELQFTGGSDIEFTSRLTQVGARIVWSDAFSSIEFVPAERCTRGWAFRRAFRVGNRAGVSKLQRQYLLGALNCLSGGLLRVAVSFACLPLTMLLRQPKWKGNLVRVICRGAGIACAPFYNYEEYRR